MATEETLIKDNLPPEEPEVVDPSGWILDGAFAEFVLYNAVPIKYMCMFVYTYLHGCKLFGAIDKNSSIPFKFISLIFQCTGGGILVPILINAIPVSLGQDAYPIAIISSFLLHHYFPIMREVVALSPVLKAALVVMFETQRASVVVKLTTAAATSIPPSDFSFAVFGPIFCGAIGGCGGAFLPLNKGLDPIRTKGLAQPMLSALIAATCYHLFLNTSLSDGVVDAAKKAHVAMAAFFILYGIQANVTLPFQVKSVDLAEKKKK